ncbi:L10-interacting MYB domain-containing protein isoform X1 [Cucurbita pepo subsp. pepo]|uniref:L10-interacting MYB domain-containing protein isoform X1 n=1 Tax=Cucurbita pepo subsp. pepo TaxID=3664 RepID=UPI000C9D5F66|nr:L10-interacting MYB domain-containing protein isoform X1 [Cucurbita pepo subsp. pepo]XP_023514335.1 L10-interacting MYB domain-containing protein isoform X1 [Cucurbita pepo subsp. pepo]
MGVQTRNSNDRLRTVWTPEMDRYFIDLMLEQVNKGNRFDEHLFSKRAWRFMISLFNAKFKFEYEKDVLKNRHKTLRNLFKAVKNLLDQRGFSWDEVRQMVTAENHVWDEYVKEHPEARSFRIKSIPYYNDLCIIYGGATVGQKGIYSQESSHSGDNETMYTKPLGTASEGDVEALNGIMIGEDYKISVSGDVDELPQMSTTATTAISRSRTYWQPPMDRFFIDLMLEQVQKGNQIDGIFRKHSWAEMIASFNAKFGFNYDVDVLKNRYKTLRRQYNVIKNLLDLDGFLWDETRQMITADDYIWQDYIKAHTDARQFMTRPVPYYKDLCVICDPSFDERECSPGQGIEQHHDAEDGKLSIGFQSPITSVSSEEQASEKESTHLGPKNKRELESMSSFDHNKKLRGEDESMASALREMASFVSSLSDKKKNDDNSSSISIETVIEAIQALPNMDEDLVLDACDLLEDEKKAKTFIALDVKLRRKWLIRKLRPEGATHLRRVVSSGRNRVRFFRLNDDNEISEETRGPP